MISGKWYLITEIWFKKTENSIELTRIIFKGSFQYLILVLRGNYKCKETGSGNIIKIHQRTFYREKLDLSQYIRYWRHFLHKHLIKRTFDLSCLIEISVTIWSYFSNLSEHKRNYWHVLADPEQTTRTPLVHLNCCWGFSRFRL